MTAAKILNLIVMLFCFVSILHSQVVCIKKADPEKRKRLYYLSAITVASSCLFIIVLILHAVIVFPLYIVIPVSAVLFFAILSSDITFFIISKKRA